METINLLRIELAEEVATLPEALRSSYPDLAVDFLYTVFKEAASNPISRLPASALEEALAATEAAAPSPPPFPSEERLKAAKTFTDGIEADAAQLAKQSALSTDAFASLLAHREPASGDSCEGSLSGLVKCLRCKKIMFASVKAHHATLCKIRQAAVATGPVGAGAATAAAPNHSDWQPPSYDTGMNDNDNGVSKGRKRKQQQSYNDNLFSQPPTSKSRLSRDSGAQHAQHAGIPPIQTTVRNDEHQYQYQYDPRMQPPLSPMLAAAAAVRQGRSAPNRERRRQLAYLPNQDLLEPLILNRSPVRGARPGAAGGNSTAAERRAQRHGGGPVPLRLASQNSEELKSRTGSGPVVVAATPVQQEQQQGTRLFSAQQAQQVYQQMQNMRAQGAVTAASANMAALLDGKPQQHMLPTMQGTLVFRNGAWEMQQPNGATATAAAGGASAGAPQQRYIALPPQISQQFAAQLQYAHQLRQHQQQQQQQQQQQVPGGRGAPVLQRGSGNGNVAVGGNTTFIPLNGIHQAFTTSLNSGTAVPATGGAVPAAMYRQFVPSTNPTVPQ